MREIRLTRLPASAALLALGACSGGGGSDAPATSPPSALVVARVTVTPGTLDLSVGESATLQAQGLTATGAAVSGRTVQWTSSAPATASVTAGGVVSGVAAGSASITATIDGITGSATATVRATLSVLPDTVTLTSIGAQVNTTVTLNGQPATGATFGVTSDRRWLHDRAVIDSAQLGAGRVVAFGAGRAVLRVTAGGLSDTIVVNVTPTQPHVFAVVLPGGRTHLGSGDTVQLRGYRMHQITPASIQPAGLQIAITGQDSATARLVVPTLQTSSCAGRAPTFTLSWSGATGQSSPQLSQKRSAELALGVGESRKLTAAEQTCLRLARATGARYLLAYVDGRLTEKAKTGPEYPWPDSVRVTVADQGSSQPSARVVLPPVASRGVAAEPHAALALPGSAGTTLAVPTGCPFLNTWFPFCRATAWQAGELVTHYSNFSNRPAGPARILAVRGNLVFGVFQADSSQLPAGAVARTDSAMQLMAQRGIPLLQSIFGLPAPTTTSDESGQLYMMLEASTFPGGASWYADPPSGHGRWGRITFGLSPTSAFGFPQASYANPLIIIAHEVLHTYQFRWRYQYASPWLTYLGSSWGVEGGATFFSMEMIREATGTPFLGNTVIPAVPSSDPRAILSLYGSRVGDFPMGYANTSGFLRDLVQRLVSSGMTFDAAMREVLTGAMEGWYGINEEGQARGQGLTARMRARLGTAWNPNDALLDWTMSEAADDQTSNPRFQNLTVRMSQPSPANSPFPPHAVVAIGTSVTVLRHPGTSGVFEVLDDVGGSYRAAADVKGVPTSQVEWLLLRVR